MYDKNKIIIVILNGLLLQKGMFFNLKGKYLCALSRTPINLSKATVWKYLYTNNIILYYGFFYHLDIERA